MAETYKKNCLRFGQNFWPKRIPTVFLNKFFLISFPFKFVRGINSGKVYGTEPKCIRVKEIYTLLYFVVYGYDGELISDQVQARELLRTRNPVLDGLDCEMFDDLPDIYKVIFKTNLIFQRFFFFEDAKFVSQ